MYQLVNTITCEIADTALPNSVFGFFMDFNETLHIDSLRSSNLCPAKLNGRIMHRAVLLFLDVSHDHPGFLHFFQKIPDSIVCMLWALAEKKVYATD